MSEYLQAVNAIAGSFIVICGSLWLIVFAVFKVCEIIHDVRNARCKDYVLGQLNEISRWNAYEFPAVEQVCEEMKYRLNHGWITGGHDNFREKLRAKIRNKSMEERG